MTNCHGVLLDTVSIQRYIFQSNELKENIGASYIIECLVYGKYLKEAMKCVLPSYQLDKIDEWKTSPDKGKNLDPVEIGYIGGGNALILFKEKGNAEEFIRQWTRILMVKAPQVIAAVAPDKFDLDNFRESKTRLFRQLRNNKLQYAPQTVIPSHGITAACPRSGLSQDTWSPLVKAHISGVSHARIEAGKAARDEIKKKYKDIIQDDFTFPNEFSKLGQIEGEDSHIAIVHIDGNDISEQFRAVTSLPVMREKSITIDKITRSAFESLLSYIVSKYSKIMNDLGFDNLSKDPTRRYPFVIEDGRNKYIIPIQPMIIGGDDITFVCDGKLGLYFAEKYIRYFEDEARNKGLDITVCAGVAIIKTKYPFFRGYRLAEELCRNAKNVRKAEDEKFSYLDFHVASGALSGPLDRIRHLHYRVPRDGSYCRLYCRPYRMDWENCLDEKSFSLLVKNAGLLKKDLPNNKIHALRDVLNRPKATSDKFLMELKARDQKLPAIPGKSFENNIFEPIMEAGEEIYATPYLDMIELIQYYPFLPKQKA